MTIDSNTALQAGMNAFKAGDKSRARDLLMALVETDETNEQAWVWLAGAMDDPEEQQTCLENALHLNPDNPQAQQGLAWLRKHHPQLFAPPTPPAAPPPAASGFAPPPLAAPPPAVSGFAPPPPASLPPSAVAGAAAPAGAIFIPIPVRPGDAPAGPPPCPKCGKPTQLSDPKCGSCGQDLMEQVERENVKRIWSLLAGVGLMLSMLLNMGLGGYMLFAANQKTVAIKAPFAEEIKDIERTVRREKDEAKREPLLTKLMAPITAEIEQQNQQLVQPVFSTGIPLTAIGGLGVLLAFALLRRGVLAYWVSWGYTLLALGYLLLFNPGGRFASQVTTSELSPPPAALLSSFAILPVLPVAVLIFLGLAIPQYTNTRKRFVAPEGSDSDDEEHFNRGVSYSKRGFIYQAMVEWERAVKVTPHDATYRHALAVAYAQLKRHEDAVREINEALSLDPTNAEIKQAHKQLTARQR